MTEIKGETAPEAAKALLALNPTQESEFRKKVQEVKKNKSQKVSEKMNQHTKSYHAIFPSQDITSTMLSSYKCSLANIYVASVNIVTNIRLFKQNASRRDHKNIAFV